MVNSTHKVEVFRVTALEKHPNADLLSIMPVFNYQAVVRTSDFRVGDLACYIPPDNVLPDKPEYEFLKGHRHIKAAKLRGIMSQGLVLAAPAGAQEGDDVAELLGIIHYVPEIKNTGDGEMIAAPSFSGEIYDVDSWFRYDYLIPDGTLVEITEKLDGCLAANTRILMADGSTEMLGVLVNQNRVGEEVLGVDDTGTIVPTKITNVFNNGATKKWVNVEGTRYGCGRGNYCFSIYCTPNHKFYSPTSKSYISAEELSPGCHVLLYRSEYILTPLQRSVLLGKMLGDGSLSYNEHSASVSFNHKMEHRAYVEWTLQGLGTLAAPWRGKQVSGYGTQMLRARTIQRVEVFEYLQDFIDGETGEKHVPFWVEKELTPLALAFWYMDDGTLSHNNGQEDRVSFAVCAFNEFDCNILMSALKKYDITAQYSCPNEYSTITLNADNAEKLFLLIAPYVPPVMQYKLPQRYRGHTGWLPNSTNEYKPILTDQIITNIVEVRQPSGTKSPVRYDLETVTHNFFANGVLVHNSNIRASFQNGQLWVSSRENWRKENPGGFFWRAMHQNPWLERLCRQNPDCIVYGELFGKVQDLRYGAQGNQVWFRMFDIMTPLGFMNYAEKMTALQVAVGSDPWEPCYVPVLYVGPLTKEVVMQYMNGPSTVPGAKHEREGCVIKPLNEMWSSEFGRIILKAVSFLSEDKLS